jgi:hypothetical protein
MLEEDGLARNQIHQLHLVFDFEFATALTTPGARRVPEVVNEDDAANREQWLEEVQRVEGRLKKSVSMCTKDHGLRRESSEISWGKKHSIEDIWGVKQIRFQESLNLGEVC